MKFRFALGNLLRFLSLYILPDEWKQYGCENVSDSYMIGHWISVLRLADGVFLVGHVRQNGA